MNTHDRQVSAAGVSRGKPDGSFMVTLRAMAFGAAAGGAAGTLALILRAGHRNPSHLLIAMFVAWDLSPFVALTWANAISKRWTTLTRVTLYVITIVIVLTSIALYTDVVLHPPQARPAFRFLAVPFASWVLLTLAVGLASLMSRKAPE